VFYRALGFAVWKIAKRIVHRKAPAPVGRRSRGRAVFIVPAVAALAIAVVAGAVAKARSGGSSQLTP
jgi:hypothetical protein